MEEEIIGRFYDGRLMRRLLTYLRPYWRTVLGGGVLLAACALAQVALPLLTRIAVDRYMAPAEIPVTTIVDRWLPVDRASGIAVISAVYLAVLALAAVCDFANGYLVAWAGQRAMSDMRRQVMRHLQTLDIEFFDRNPVGRLVTRATTDVDALNDLFTSGVIAIFGDLLMLLLIAVAMTRLSPRLTVLVLSMMPFVVYATLQFRRQISHSYRRARIAVARINAYLAEHINGMSVIQLFNREDKCLRAFEPINHESRAAQKEALVAHAWFNPLIEFQGMLALAVLLAWGGYWAGHGTVTLGVLVAFFQYALRFFRPIQELSDKYNVLQSAIAASEKIFALLDTPHHVTTPASPQPVPESPATIEFDHVWFAYKPGEWVLRDVSFTIRPGQTMAIVGHTGAGKTTITSLLLRFYDVQRGQIRVGGVDVREMDPCALRRHFGVVLQDPHLFAGTIGDNIRLGTAGITDDDAWRALAGVGLRDWVRTLPGALSAEVLERGHGYSVGQKQLISFARALAHNPPYLILDEATSSVDSESERQVRDALDTVLTNRTAIVIAHRLSTIQRADCILVLHKGRLREQGTHQELLALGGIYARLHRHLYDRKTPAVAPVTTELATA